MSRFELLRARLAARSPERTQSANHKLGNDSSGTKSGGADSAQRVKLVSAGTGWIQRRGNQGSQGDCFRSIHVGLKRNDNVPSQTVSGIASKLH